MKVECEQRTETHNEIKIYKKQQLKLLKLIKPAEAALYSS